MDAVAPGEVGHGRAGILTGLNVLNYADRYVGAAMLPLILSSLALTDARADCSSPPSS